ncbi:MAG: helix-turn-helix transcriptional regulator, partial [Phycisphaerales bacterium JB039]
CALPICDKDPAILSAAQAAELLGVAKSTLYRRVSEGAFRSCVRRGKPLLFWRDRLIQAAFSSRW